MKIIKNPNPKPRKVIVCDECECKFSYNKSDIKFGNEPYVVCPNCGRTFYHP